MRVGIIVKELITHFSTVYNQMAFNLVEQTVKKKRNFEIICILFGVILNSSNCT